MAMENSIQTGRTGRAAGTGFDGAGGSSVNGREKTDGCFSDIVLEKSGMFRKDGSPRGVFPRDVSSRDISPRNTSSSDAFPRDISPRNTSSRDVFPRDISPNIGFPENISSSNGFPENISPSNGFPENISPTNGFPEDISPRNMTLTEYKMYIDDIIKSLYIHPSQRHVSWFIDITDAAYRRMQADPLYEQQVLDYLARNKAANVYGHAPRFVYIHIEDTWDKTCGYALGVQDDSRARRAEERRRMAAEAARKARRKKLLKEYLRKRAEAKWLQDKLLKKQFLNRLLERQRLTGKWKERERKAQALEEKEAEETRVQAQEVKEWVGERKAEAARNAYEAGIIMMIRQEEQMFT